MDSEALRREFSAPSVRLMFWAAICCRSCSGSTSKFPSWRDPDKKTHTNMTVHLYMLMIDIPVIPFHQWLISSTWNLWYLSNHISSDNRQGSKACFWCNVSWRVCIADDSNLILDVCMLNIVFKRYKMSKSMILLLCPELIWAYSEANILQMSVNITKLELKFPL